MNTNHKSTPLSRRPNREDEQNEQSHYTFEIFLSNPDEAQESHEEEDKPKHILEIFLSNPDSDSDSNTVDGALQVQEQTVEQPRHTYEIFLSNPDEAQEEEEVKPQDPSGLLELDFDVSSLPSPVKEALAKLAEHHALVNKPEFKKVKKTGSKKGRGKTTRKPKSGVKNLKPKRVNSKWPGLLREINAFLRLVQKDPKTFLEFPKRMSAADRKDILQAIASLRCLDVDMSLFVNANGQMRSVPTHFYDELLNAINALRRTIARSNMLTGEPIYVTRFLDQFLTLVRRLEQLRRFRF